MTFSVGNEYRTKNALLLARMIACVAVMIAVTAISLIGAFALTDVQPRIVPLRSIYH